MIRQYRLRDYNFRLILWVEALAVLGVLLVGSAESSLQMKQCLGVIGGSVIMIVVSLIDFSWIIHFNWILYILNLAILIAVRILGKSANGATRWVTIAGIRFQPVELAKIILIIFFARYFMDRENKLNKPLELVKALFFLAIPVILIILQPDLKNTLTIVMLFSIIYFIAGLSYKYILGVLIIAVPLIVIFMGIVSQPDQTLVHDYQRNRIMAFLNPDNPEYTDGQTQQNNSVVAIGSGMLYGKGLNNSDVTSANKGNFISEIETDFIFAVAGEELGFIGSGGIILLLFLIVLECILISMRAKDLSGKIIACGMGALISIQSFINIGVATRMLPNTGTPLPFVSYGLTSLTTMYIGIGLVLNVGLQGKIRLAAYEKRSYRSSYDRNNLRRRGR